MKVFISYSKEDYKLASKLYDDLIRNGISPWMDPLLITLISYERPYFITL